MRATATLFGGLIKGTSPRLIELPPLPRSIRYWDDFAECHRTLSDLENANQIVVHDDGQVVGMDLASYSSFQRRAFLHIVCHIFERNDVTSVVEWINVFKSTSRRSLPSLLDCFAALQPFELRMEWEAHIFPDLVYNSQGRALKKILHVFCDLRVGAWAPEFRSIVSNLSTPKVDPFAAVKSGVCFVPPQHQQMLYGFLDEVARLVLNGESLSSSILRDAVALLMIDQHGLRPGTVARIKQADLRYHDNGAVHVSVIIIKKQNGSERIHVTRRVKREWCPIVRAFDEARTNVASAADDRFLGLTPTGITKVVGDRMHIITGERWTATDLRHTAAQRMVDSGASADQLAEFMGHNSVLVGNCYFEHSPAQANRVNQALAISPIYSPLAEIHRTKTIDKAALLALPEEKQIGGAPHGISISGIGACQLGQSACSKNPVLSCYGCNKFLPLREAEVHSTVVESLRPVVLDFYKAGCGDARSPAYAQLQRTLNKAAEIANDILKGDAQ